ncbi:MAG: TetR/AcrR family transcriptional regulator [Flavobacteriaceae bacterium]|nr:TetR/AcrR family transcriptional regulator [Flavobacteriaceae bacterium]
MRTKSIEKREALLNATLNLVNNNGFHATPMSKIAKLAGVSPATIYLYFKSKQDLINQLYINSKIAFTKEAFINYDPSMPVKKGFELIWYNIANYKLKQTDTSSFLAQCETTPMIDSKVREEALEYFKPLLLLWKRGQQEEIIKPIASHLLYANAIYPLTFLLSAHKRGDFILDEKQLKIAFDAAWDSIKQ